VEGRDDTPDFVEVATSPYAILFCPFRHANTNFCLAVKFRKLP